MVRIRRRCRCRLEAGGRKSQLTPPDAFKFPTDHCIFCAGKQGLRNFRLRKKQRPDSLRHCLENIHLNHFAEDASVPCPFEIYGGEKFENVYAWPSHAARVHKYDSHVKLHH